ncbi:MAG: hypothetical protein H6Q02_1682, partial [Acidobacteria bacterium]|nr:hypothetical protein [Acidobacteriota bacterium]
TTRELLRPEQVPQVACDWHRDPAAGGPTLALPARYRDWAARQGLVVAAAPARDGAVAGRLAVLAPADRDAFVLSPELPRRFQSLELRCEAPGAAGEVVWLVDGREHARVAASTGSRSRGAAAARPRSRSRCTGRRLKGSAAAPPARGSTGSASPAGRPRAGRPAR